MKNVVIKVLIADDHDLIRQGLKRLIGLEQDMEIIGEAENGEKALKLIEQQKPDVALLDFNMPLLNGIEVLKRIKEKNDGIRVIMLTVENHGSTLNEAINVGADGYVLKDSAGTEIVDAIRSVFDGEKYIDKSLIKILFNNIRSKEKKDRSILDDLSRRELEVLIKISKGLSNKEIGEQLFLSEKTVKNYATNLFRKINVDDRVQATILGIKNNIDEYYSDRYGKENRD